MLYWSAFGPPHNQSDTKHNRLTLIICQHARLNSSDSCGPTPECRSTSCPKWSDKCWRIARGILIMSWCVCCYGVMVHEYYVHEYINIQSTILSRVTQTTFCYDKMIYMVIRNVCYTRMMHQCHFVSFSATKERPFSLWPPADKTNLLPIFDRKTSNWKETLVDIFLRVQLYKTLTNHSHKSFIWTLP